MRQILRKIKKKGLFIVIVSIVISCTNLTEENEKFEKISVATNEVFLSSQINWEKLNPARGDNSPQAGTIWGDRKGTVPTGFLAKFKDGFSSPPHIHNVTYRALVISGLIHNDDPDAEEMWMPAGSFWTQPAGEPHITSAKGGENIVYVEIDEGPYLVKPIEEAFDNGERPVNMDKSNIVWLDASKTSFINGEISQSGPKVAFLWESGNLTGNLIKLPPKFEGKILSRGEIFRAIVISGEISYALPKTNVPQLLDPGSYFTSKGKSIHEISTSSGTECIVYIRTEDKFTIY